jgi:hypothetical protein
MFTPAKTVNYQNLICKTLILSVLPFKNRLVLRAGGGRSAIAPWQSDLPKIF